VNVVSLKTPFVRVTVSAVLALALLALPIPLPGQTAYAATRPGPIASGTWNRGNVINLIFGYWPSSTNPPPLTAFDVQVDGVANPVTAIGYFGSIVDLTLTFTVYRGSEIRVSYRPPTENNDPSNAALQDSNGIDTEEFLNLLINNDAGPRPVQTTPTPIPTDSGLPSWDTEPLTDSETDAFTEGIWPSVIPGNIIITNEFGFTVDKKNGIKPKIRMKNYAGKITKMTLSATYRDGSKTKKYKCVYADFGSTKKVKTAKWKWYTPKKACILPAPLVDSIQKGTATLSAKGKWSRQWVTSAKKTRPDKTKIKARTLRYTVKGVPR
jgi:hypothetical protein